MPHNQRRRKEVTTSRILAVMAPETDGEACKRLASRYDVTFTQTLRPTLKQIKEFDPMVVLIDTDANTLGKIHRITQAAKAHYRRPFVILIKSGRGIPKSIKYYDTVLSRPFVAKRLISTIEKQLASRPDFVIQVPPFTLDRRTNVMIGPKGMVQLGPKMGKIMALFMEEPRQAINSMTLIKKVWGSNKPHNTRTLHVHVHWLRRLIEENVSTPHYLITVDKGMGYMLDLPDTPVIGGEALYLPK
jgi:DNA-binding response OmpR family regulator